MFFFFQNVKSINISILHYKKISKTSMNIYAKIESTCLVPLSILK